jgi:hypothetical protein
MDLKETNSMRNVIRVLALALVLGWSSQAAALTFFIDKTGGDCTAGVNQCADDGTTPLRLELSFQLDAGDTAGSGGMNGIFTSVSWTNGNNITAKAAVENANITIQGVQYLPLIGGVATSDSLNQAQQWDFINILGNPSTAVANPFAQAPSAKTVLGFIRFNMSGVDTSDGGSSVITFGTVFPVDGLTLDGVIGAFTGTNATYTIGTVPEPATAGLLGLGLLGLLIGGRKRS